MVTISIKVDTSKFENYMGQLPLKLSTAIGLSIRRSAFLIEREAKIEAPVDTGRLRSSIYSDIKFDRATVSTYVNYAQYVHDGTRFIRANPFMERAVHNSEDDVQRIFDDEINRAIK